MSVIRKYHNHTLQANPRHREEEPTEQQQSQDIMKTNEKQSKNNAY